MRKVECVVCDRIVEEMTRREMDNIDEEEDCWDIGVEKQPRSDNRMVLELELMGDCDDNRNGEDELMFCCRNVEDETDEESILLFLKHRRGCCSIALKIAALAEDDNRPPLMIVLDVRRHSI